MTNIRTTKNSKGKTLYNAKDICEAAGVSWRGKETMAGLKPGSDYFLLKAPLQVSPTVCSETWHYVFTDKGVTELTKNKGVDNPLKTVTIKNVTEVENNKTIGQLVAQVKNLKSIVADLLVRIDEIETNQVDKDISDDIVTEEPPEISDEAARQEIRQLTADYAKKLAAQHGVSKSDMSVFYDLTFNILYTKYKYKYKIDIKKEADQADKSGLQIAEDYGILQHLLLLARNVLKTKQETK